jgi:uncharacterized pyridoxamine 5'-phosphate oxidase family protein
MVTTSLDRRYSSEQAQPTDWADARQRLREAETFWISTVRPDGRPHVTPLIAVWSGDALYFCTGPEERKALNLAENAHCVLTTGRDALNEGLDLVVEGDAVRVSDNAQLRELAREWEQKYGPDWHFDARDGAFHHESGQALVFEVAPTTAFGFAKGAYGQTRWRFSPS